MPPSPRSPIFSPACSANLQIFSEDDDVLGQKKSEKQRLLQPFDLSEEVGDHLIGRMNERTFPAGDVVVSEGDPGDSLYVIAAGTLLVLKRN